MPAVVLASPLGAVSARRAVVPNGTREMARNATALPTRSSRFPLACRAERVSGYSTVGVAKGRKRRVIKPLTGNPARPALDAELLGDNATDCPSDGCSIETSMPDADHDAPTRGAMSSGSSTEEAHERQRAQIESLRTLREVTAPAVRRKRRVLKPLSKNPDPSATWGTVDVEEGNCPSDGCSIEYAAPADESAPIRRRGYQASKHSDEEAREKWRAQLQNLKEQRAADEKKIRAALEAAAADDDDETADAMTEEEKVKAKAQKEAFYFSVAGLTALTGLGFLHPETAAAAVATPAGIDPFFQFNPVCPASDGVFRVGQRAALALAGDQNIENYRPLINDVLIRVRTELCVLESFSRETALPFVKEKGLGWVLPIHETSETYLAGVVFMVGANFILLGSTKVVAILAIYHDLSLGLLARGAGRLLGMATPEAEEEKREREFNELMEKQMAEVKGLMMNPLLSREDREKQTAEVNARYAAMMEDTKAAADVRAKGDETSALSKARKGAGAVAVPLRLYGKASGLFRQGCEVFDTFCSRYFVAFTVTYIIVKTAHYVFFPTILDGVGKQLGA
tara:strand:- start:28 stop:1737 length:1710 start_codon:yes stop_codon:yes gene_type:complete